MTQCNPAALPSDFLLAKAAETKVAETKTLVMTNTAFGALTLFIVGRQEEHPACKK